MVGDFADVSAAVAQLPNFLATTPSLFVFACVGILSHVPFPLFGRSWLGILHDVGALK